MQVECATCEHKCLGKLFLFAIECFRALVFVILGSSAEGGSTILSRFETMAPAPKKHANATASPASGEQSRKVSNKRLEGTVVSLQKESDTERTTEQMKVIWDECMNNRESRERCHGLCTQIANRIIALPLIHRNWLTFGQLAYLLKEKVLVTNENIFTEKQLEAMSKLQIVECYGIVIGVVSCINIGIVAFEKGETNIAEGNGNKEIPKDLGKSLRVMVLFHVIRDMF